MSTFSTLILCGTLVTGGAANVTTRLFQAAEMPEAPLGYEFRGG